MTLKSGIENMLMHYIPEVKSVVEVRRRLTKAASCRLLTVGQRILLWLAAACGSRGHACLLSWLLRPLPCSFSPVRPCYRLFPQAPPDEAEEEGIKAFTKLESKLESPLEQHLSN